MLGLADRWHMPTSAVLAEHAEILRDLAIEQLATANREGGDM